MKSLSILPFASSLFEYFGKENKDIENNACTGNFTVPNGFNGVMFVTATGGGGGGGAVLNLIEGKGGNGGNGFVILEYKSTMLD